mmetsp:Transcript_7536/g.16016  ORF Transcript_7536/g.16016 Transcript_7536/m.16016 type:complete len:1052 (+) Transcript_7536:291-3446(+)
MGQGGVPTSVLPTAPLRRMRVVGHGESARKNTAVCASSSVSVGVGTTAEKVVRATSREEHGSSEHEDDESMRRIASPECDRSRGGAPYMARCGGRLPPSATANSACTSAADAVGATTTATSSSFASAGGGGGSVVQQQGTGTRVAPPQVRRRLSIPTVGAASEVMELRAKLDELLREVGRPPLVAHDYGYEWMWSRDPFTLFHNAVRRELEDVYSIMLPAMRKAEFLLEEAALQDFKQWWDSLALFIKVYLNLQRRVLVPRLLAVEPPDAEGSHTVERFDSLSRDKANALSAMSRVSSSLEAFARVYDVRTLLAFTAAVDAAAYELEQYMRREVDVLGELMEKFLCPEDMLEIERELVAGVIQGENAAVGVIVLTRWMLDRGDSAAHATAADQRLFRDWQSRHEIGHAQYNAWLEVFVAKHRTIVRSFLELRRANQRRLDAASVPIRLPVLCLVDHGVTWSWPLDVISLCHNAVRREMMDLYTMILSIQARHYCIDLHEASEFAQWFATFRAFFLEYALNIEEKIIFPFISSFDASRINGPPHQSRSNSSLPSPHPTRAATQRAQRRLATTTTRAPPDDSSRSFSVSVNDLDRSFCAAGSAEYSRSRLSEYNDVATPMPAQLLSQSSEKIATIRKFESGASAASQATRSGDYWTELEQLKSTVLGHLSDTWNLFLELQQELKSASRKVVVRWSGSVSIARGGFAAESSRESRHALTSANHPAVRASMRKLLAKLEAWSPLVVQYMTLQERYMPRVLEASANRDSCRAVVRSIVEAVFQSPSHQDNAVILSRWIEDEESLRLWLDEHVTAARSMQFTLWRARFERKHRAIVHRFHRRRAEVTALSAQSHSTVFFSRSTQLLTCDDSSNSSELGSNRHLLRRAKSSLSAARILSLRGATSFKSRNQILSTDQRQSSGSFSDSSQHLPDSVLTASMVTCYGESPRVGGAVTNNRSAPIVPCLSAAAIDSRPMSLPRGSSLGESVGVDMEKKNFDRCSSLDEGGAVQTETQCPKSHPPPKLCASTSANQITASRPAITSPISDDDHLITFDFEVP